MFSKKYIIVLTCFLFLSNIVTWANEEIWPQTISKKDRKFLYGKIKKSLKEIRTKEKTININLLSDKKLYRGKVIKVGKTKFTIIDYKKKKHTLKYNKMKALSISKIIPSKEQKGNVLHFFGLISMHEGNKKYAQKFFERAVKNKHDESNRYLSSLNEEFNNEEESKLKERQEKKESARQERDEKELALKKKKEEERRSKIANILSLGSEEIDIAAQSFPGKYTIFKFGAPW